MDQGQCSWSIGELLANEEKENSGFVPMDPDGLTVKGAIRLSVKPRL